MSVMAGGSYDDEVLASEGWPSRFEDSGQRAHVVNLSKTDARVDLSSDEPTVWVEKTEAANTQDEAVRVLTEAQSELEKIRAASAQYQSDVMAKHAEDYRIQAEALAKIKRTAQETLNRAQKMEEVAAATREQTELDYLAKMKEAREEGDRYIDEAKNSARNKIELITQKNIQRNLDPVKVRTDPVNVDISAGTIEEICEALMEAPWECRIDFSRKPELAYARLKFTSTDPRDLAFQDLMQSIPGVRVRHQYIFDLLKDGKPAPILMISDRKTR